MLSYRHAFHAGNHADVLKHLTLIAVLQHLCHKETPFTYLDSHAGKGLYDLKDVMAEKNAESSSGIGKLWGRSFDDPLIASYLDLVRGVNSEGDPTLRSYPGSPVIAQRTSRPRDKLILMELHSREVQRLRETVGRDSRVHIHHRDGFEGLGAMIPPTPRRGLVLMDPAYEVKSDYAQVLRRAETIHRKWPGGIVAVWFPLLAVARDHGEELKRRFQKGNFGSVLLVELRVSPQRADEGMHGSAMVVINPPWNLDSRLGQSLGLLAPLLSQAHRDPVTVEWLREKS